MHGSAAREGFNARFSFVAVGFYLTLWANLLQQLVGILHRTRQQHVVLLGPAVGLADQIIDLLHQRTQQWLCFLGEEGDQPAQLSFALLIK